MGGSKVTTLELSRETTSSQMTLAIYEELFPLGVPISDAPSEIGFRRNSLFLDIYELGIVARRALDAAYFIVSQDPNVQTQYDVDQSYFKWLMNYQSNNRKHLRTVMRDVQKSAIEGDSASSDQENWGSIPLMGPVVISGGRLIFEVDRRLQKLIKDPKQSYFLSLRVSNVFTSNYARALYDHLLNYVGLGMTEWIDLETARGWSDAKSKSFTEFKYFKRNVLDIATRQINELSNIEVSYTTNNLPGTKKIGHIRFTVRQKAENVLQLAMLGSKEMYETLRNEFGLSPANFEEIMENRVMWTDEWLHQAMEFTRFCISKGKVTKSVSGFLMKAIRDNLRVSSAEREVAAQLIAKEDREQAAQQSKARQAQAVDASIAAAVARKEDEVSAEIKSGLNAFDQLDANDREEYLRQFRRSREAKLTAKPAKVDLEMLTETSLRQNQLLAKVFGQYIYRKLRVNEGAQLV
ncbi:Initiator Replication protein [Noviherbaspirillum suwonense]|uniref:Initiator Replication protein n=2 Tax=Noviherbaspirillum suwonense TaxID=1224511 RepID=A0ABY1QTA8_9BURK|nr:Initiator Replication protein [Noviherbaspirillum suwonense]